VNERSILLPPLFRDFIISILKEVKADFLENFGKSCLPGMYWLQKGS
jgi:hypothetical protein